MKIVVIGGTGLLGTALKKIDNDLICLNSDYDIVEFTKLNKKLNEISPDIIINACAIKTNQVLEDKSKSINVNIIGASNVAKYCIENNIKLVYISSDYIYKGDVGNYSETDSIFPENLYAWTKLGGECSAKLVNNHIIIRTSFGSDIFPYSGAYDNLYTSKDYVDVIAKMIIDVIPTKYIGVLNIGTYRKSIYDYANKKNIINRISLIHQKDFSLNCNLYNKLIDDIRNNVNFKYNNICPITKRDNKIKYFDLGNLPLVNNLSNSFEESINCERFPLSISLFVESGLSGLDVTIDSDKMFLNYVYRSNTNKPYLIHCKNMYSYLMKYIKLDGNDLCVDIGGNDGTLLTAFNEFCLENNINSCEKINIEPSKNISKISSDNGINTINEYFTSKIYKIIGKKAKLITTTNVFQHLLDIQEFVNGINALIDDNGIWCLEFPYWGNSMETNQFDQVYHEHMYYYLVTPLNTLFNNNGLRIVNISDQYIHGGSLRLIITKNLSNIISDNSVDYYLSKEKKFNVDYYSNWSKMVKSHLSECYDLLYMLKDSNVVGFGAAAKGCIFLNTLKIDHNFMKYVIDDTIEKQNKYIPGTGIKIVDRSILNDNKIDYILILAHNFSEYIIKSLRESNYMGKFIVLLPEIKIIE
jgi:dTDP-4-dehydrorhamnose reductase